MLQTVWPGHAAAKEASQDMSFCNILRSLLSSAHATCKTRCVLFATIASRHAALASLSLKKKMQGTAKQQILPYSAIRTNEIAGPPSGTVLLLAPQMHLTEAAVVAVSQGDIHTCCVEGAGHGFPHHSSVPQRAA